MTTTFEFNAQYNRKNFVNFLRNDFLGDAFAEEEAPIDLDGLKFNLITEVTSLGDRDDLDLQVYEVKHNTSNYNRVTLSREAFKIMLHKSMHNYALIAFLPKGEKQYRFSLLHINAEKDSKSTRIHREYSNPRRYSYVLGEGIGTYTPNQYLAQKGAVTGHDDLRERFSVEILTKAFYSELSNWFFWAKKIVQFPNDIKDANDNDKFNSEALIRMVTRLIFVWFLKQKKLIPNEFFDENYIGDTLKGFNPYDEDNLYGKSTESQYYKAILQNLFFAMLNSPIIDEKTNALARRFRKGRDDFDNNKLMRYEKFFNKNKAQEFLDLANQRVPFLNGGLFDCLDEKNKGMYYDAFTDREAIQKQLIVPDYLFFGKTAGKDTDLSDDYGAKTIVNIEGIIDILKKYNFTVEENMPYDQEVSLDPELLGNVFENLLASYNPETQTTARKQTGSYYTPREIVQFMVDESLCAYLTRKVGKQHDTTLRDLLQFKELKDEAQKEIDEIKDDVIQALYECKILDPACGSGAFPMGVLQQMVHLLSQLDPENRQWKALLTKQTKKDAADAIDEESKDEREEAIDDVKKSFDSALTYPDYARKLYLIENCIYGSDIQSIAIQISKLRFFISLVVDQKPKYDKPEENFGIRPLPNLEAKFVAADSLIGLKKNDTGSLFYNQEINEKQEQLKIAKHKIFGAKTVKTKRKYQDKVQGYRLEIAKLLKEENAVSNEEAEELAKWDMFDQNAVAPFFDPEWMFGVSDGFDIVLGNPPYRQLQANNAELGNKYKSSGFETFTSTGDIYCLFYEKSLNLLKQNGRVCLITSNKWMRAGYGEKLRNYLSKNTNPLLLVDFAGVKVFQSATVDTNILLCEKSDNLKKTLCVEMKDFGKLKGNDKECFNKLSDYVLHNQTPMNFKQVGGDSWVILSPIEQSIKKKIESVGVPLKDWDIQINYGIKTGYNDAFIIAAEKRDEILNNCKTPAERKRTEQIIRPILRGRDIKRYGYDWAGLYIIALFPSRNYDIEQYPAVKKHLLEFDKENLIECGLEHIAKKQTLLHDYCRQRLEQIGKEIRIEGKKVIINGNVQKTRKKTNNKWFETQDSIGYWEEFFKPKIVYTPVNSEYRFALIEGTYFFNNSLFMITGENIEIICALCNSKVFLFYMEKILSNGNYQYGSGRFFENLPLLKINDRHTLNTIKKLVNTASENRPPKIIDEIDQIIYELYGLSNEEIVFIKNQLKQDCN